MPGLKFRSFAAGLIASVALLGLFFLIVSLISGWTFARYQFASFWFFLVPLAIGFGVQIGLYIYVRGALQRRAVSGGVVAVTGTTSTAAMLSCCAHYLVNVLPLIATTGFVTIVSQYQIQFFWVGIVANLLGIVYILRKVMALKDMKKKSGGCCH